MRSAEVFLMGIVVGKACGPQGWCCQRRSIWCCKCESPRKANFRPSAIIDVRSCTPWTTSFLAKGTQDTRSTSSYDALGGAILLGTLAKSAVSPLSKVKVPTAPIPTAIYVQTIRIRPIQNPAYCENNRYPQLPRFGPS